MPRTSTEPFFILCQTNYRLASRAVTTGTAQNFTYVYDRWGNRWQQNVTAGSGPAPQLGNREMEIGWK